MGFNNIECFPYFAHHNPFHYEKRTSSQRMLCNCFTSMTDRQFWTPPRTRDAQTLLVLTFQATPSSCICLLYMAVCLNPFSIFSQGPFFQTEAFFLDVVYIHVKKVTVCVCIDTRTSPFPGCQNTEFLKFRKSECGNDYMHLP